MQSFGFSLFLVALALALLQVADSFPGLFGMGRSGWIAVSVAQFAAGLGFALSGFLQYRCPKCRNIIKGQDRYYFGVDLDPTDCPHCGVRLRR